MATVLGKCVLWILLVVLGFYDPTTGALSTDHFRVGEYAVN